MSTHTEKFKGEWQEPEVTYKNKYVYDKVTESFQIWLDRPGRLEEGDQYTITLAEPGGTLDDESLWSSQTPERLADIVEFDGTNYTAKEWMRALRDFDSSQVTEQFVIRQAMPRRRYRVTIEVEAYDITQVMSEALTGQNALIQLLED